MGDKTGISWTDATWNPIRGCSRTIARGAKQSGCGDATGGGCYAEATAGRFCKTGQPYEGLVRITAKGARWTGDVRLITAHLADPLRWKRPRRIFVNSMSDMFHEELSNEAIAAMFGVMAAAPQHTFQILTKRARRMREWFEWVHAEFLPDELNSDRIDILATWAADELGDGTEGDQERWFERVRGLIQDGNAGFPHDVPWPLPNVWLGVSTENQEAADERIPELLKAPAVVRFISAEPLLGSVNLKSALVGAMARRVYRDAGGTDEASIPSHLRPPPTLDWVIAGCESGHRARPCEFDWLRALRDQCAAAGVPYFLKQAKPWDEGRHGVVAMGIGLGDGTKSKPGGVLELPYLDGVQHAAMPGVRR